MPHLGFSLRELQEVEGKVQEILSKAYVGLIDALQHSWKSITPKTHKLLPVLLCETPPPPF
jgi:hypothetical protein